MNLLGISGHDKALSFKKAHWPGLDERDYRIFQGQDSAAALLVDGELVAAAAEERFNGKKHTGDFPIGAINYCLQEAKLPFECIDAMVHCFDYSPYEKLYSLDPLTHKFYDEVVSRQALLRVIREHFPGFPSTRIRQVDHHIAHAASAYFTSGWPECLVVVMDAMGETSSVSTYHARGGSLHKIGDIPSTNSIGTLYSLVTLHLGFDFNADEYKIMGLAPYGDPDRYRHFFEHAVKLLPDGFIRIPILELNRTRDERENFLRTREYLSKCFIKSRQPNDEIRSEHSDAAAALQNCLNRTILHICGSAAARTHLRLLALAGGVALNCAATGKLMRSGLFDEIYIQPAAGDDGAALGATLYVSSLNGQVRNGRLPVPFFGPSYHPSEIDTALMTFADRISVHHFSRLPETCATAADLIAQGKVLAWFRGRMEFGPRALGNRSILADPGRPEMRDRINAMVKKREAFRPFAPAVSLEEASKWFNVQPGAELPYMTVTVDVRPEHRERLPAITHKDGSARIQTVSSSNNPDFHSLLQAVGERTGKQMVLNTSFNVKGQPIVNSPREALETFLGTELDALFIEDVLVTRRG